MIYDRKTLLSLRLRASMGLRKKSRRELFSALQLIRTIDPMTDEAYKLVEQEAWRNNGDNAPHGQPWHVSFHGSQFPGDSPLACPRQALYQMMDFPSQEPFTRRSRTVMAAGKAIEVELVRTWDQAGILLSAPPDSPVQTGFEISDAWLTSSTDAIVLPPRTNKPLPVEVKSKYHEQIELMRLGARGPDDAHVVQAKVQVCFVRAVQEAGEAWSAMDLCDHGYLFYLSRDNPSITAEFRVDYDPHFFEAGIQRLKEWKALFMEDMLPELKTPAKITSRSHPNGWRWSYPPCSWCNFKRTCQLDHQQRVSALSESVGIERAKLVRPDYDPAAARERVISRWTVPSSGKILTTNRDDPEQLAAGSSSADSK